MEDEGECNAYLERHASVVHSCKLPFSFLADQKNIVLSLSSKDRSRAHSQKTEVVVSRG